MKQRERYQTILNKLLEAHDKLAGCVNWQLNVLSIFAVANDERVAVGDFTFEQIGNAAQAIYEKEKVTAVAIKSLHFPGGTYATIELGFGATL